MRNFNPTGRGIRTGIIIIVCLVIVSKFNLINRTESTIDSMGVAYNNIHSYYEDR